MEVVMCDACKKIIPITERKWASGISPMRRIDLCPECSEKYENFKNEYEEASNKTHDAMDSMWRQGLKQIGIISDES